MEFTLHSNLKKKSFIIDLSLCRVLFEDNQLFPWIILVPRRQGASKVMDLSHMDQLQLIKELDTSQNLMWNEFQPTQLNIGIIGNKTPQLHIHLIARYDDDAAWPNTVWDYPEKILYDEKTKASRILRFQHLFSPSGSSGLGSTG